MPEYLKGNYKGPKVVRKEETAAEKKAALEHDFEKSALEKLGGSIAFVMKSKTFLWEPKDVK